MIALVRPLPSIVLLSCAAIAGATACDREEARELVQIAEDVGGDRWLTLPAGTHPQGSPHDEACRDGDEERLDVTIARPLTIGAFEVTQAAFEGVMGYNPSWRRDCPTCPVDSVTHDEAEAYCNALSREAELAACYACRGEGPSQRCEEVAPLTACAGYRLPTEAEWEWAARAGVSSALPGGAVTSCMARDPVADEVAWYKSSSRGESHPVGGRAPNAWGLHDMAGNVYEWTADWYAAERVGGVDPRGAAQGTRRVLRGGSWYHNAEHLRAASRFALKPGTRLSYVGFRCVRSDAAPSTTQPALAPAIPPAARDDEAPAEDPSGERPDVVVAAVQWGKGDASAVDPSCDEQDANCAVEALVRRAAARRASLVVTPEYGLVQRSPEPAPSIGERPDPSRAPVAARFAELADQLDVHLVIALETKEGWRHHNSQLALDPEGRLVAKHHKIELYGGERSWLTPGSDVMTFDTAFGRVGLLICADIYGEPRIHQELIRERGARVLALSSMWTVPRAMRWQAAFARDWNLYVVAANVVRGEGRGGGVFDPEGQPLDLHESPEPGITLATIRLR